MAITPHRGAVQRRLSGLGDARSWQGIFSRGRANAPSIPKPPVANQEKPATTTTNLFKPVIPQRNWSNPQATHGAVTAPPIATMPRNWSNPQATHDFLSKSKFGPTGQPAPKEDYVPGFDPIYEQIMNSINNRLSQLTSDEEYSKRGLANQFQQARKDLGVQRERGLENNIINMADRGLVHSGINIGEQGRINEGFQRGTADLASEENASLESMLREFVQQRGALEEEKMRAEIDRLAREEERALAEEERKANEEARRQAQEQLDNFMREQQERYNRLLQNAQPKPGATGKLNPSTGPTFTKLGNVQIGKGSVKQPSKLQQALLEAARKDNKPRMSPSLRRTKKIASMVHAKDRR